MAAVASLSKQLCSAGGVHMLNAVEHSVQRYMALPLRLSAGPARKALSTRAPTVCLGTTFLGDPNWQVSEISESLDVRCVETMLLCLDACMQRLWPPLHAAEAPPPHIGAQSSSI